MRVTYLSSRTHSTTTPKISHLPLLIQPDIYLTYFLSGQPEKRSATNLRIGFIVVSAIFGLFLVGVVFFVLRYRRTQRIKRQRYKRKRRSANAKVAETLTSCEAT